MWRERKMIKNRHGGRCISFAVTLNGVSRLVTFPESSDGPRLERVYWMVAFRYKKEEILIFTTSILSISRHTNQKDIRLRFRKENCMGGNETVKYSKEIAFF